jgi:hypothetical protein
MAGPRNNGSQPGLSMSISASSDDELAGTVIRNHDKTDEEKHHARHAKDYTMFVV